MAEQNSTGRVAVVTGGSRGIGRRSAVRLADQGVAVVIVYASNDVEGTAAVAEVTERGGRAIAVRADVADEKAMAEVFEQAEQTFGGVDILVHAAGRMALAPLAELDLDVLDAVHRTNIRGTFVTNQQAARRLRPGGSIVNFSTSVLGTSFPEYSAYASSKGAVEAMTLILARELHGRDVTVNAVAPGPTGTDLFFEGKDEQQIARLADAVPLQRLGTPGDIAELVAFLTSAAGHWVNGQNIRVNGGLA